LIATGRCDAAALAAEPVEIVRRLLTLAIAKVAGADPARIPLEAMERLAEDARAAAAGGGRHAANVAGALASVRGGVVSVSREPARRSG
jgi:hypothetical protein